MFWYSGEYACFVQGGTEPAGTFWHKKKGLEWNAPVQCTKEPVYYIFVTLIDILKVASLISKTLSYMIHEIVKNSANELLILFEFLSQIGRLITCAVCVRFLRMHSFNYPHRKKLGTVTSSKCTGHGIPDTWKCCSSINLHATYSVTEQVLRWHDSIFFLVRRFLSHSL
jgi:hypothetical protein